MRLLIVILNYRTPQLTVECLRSLAGEVNGIADCRVVVADNASGDGSERIIPRAIDENRWGAWATFKALPRNGGFAWGNNRGLEECPDARFVLLLNSDTVMHPGTIQYCLRTLEGDRTIGILSCKVLNADGTNQNVTRKIPTPANQAVSATGLPWKWPSLFGWADTEDPSWDRSTRRDVGWVGGAFMFVNGEMVRSIGLLDEAFFFYGEDIEFCHRAWRNGWRVHYDPTVSITHYGGASSDPTRLPEAKRSNHRWAARYLVQRKCHGRLAEWAVRAIDYASYAGRLMALACAGQRGAKRYVEMDRAFAALRMA